MTDDRMDPFVWHNFGCVFPPGHKVNGVLWWGIVGL